MSADRAPTASDGHRSSWLHAGHEMARVAGPVWWPDQPADPLPTAPLGCQTIPDRRPDRVSAVRRRGVVPTMTTSARVKSP